MGDTRKTYQYQAGGETVSLRPDALQLADDIARKFTSLNATPRMLRIVTHPKVN